MPGEGLTHGPPAEKNAGGSHHRCSRINRHSLRDGLRLIRALLGDRLSCPRQSLGSSNPTTLASAPGCQDHATSPSAKRQSSAAALTSTAPRTQRIVTTRTPLA